MELRHLRCFGVLAEELHFTRVAERLHIEQPPFSRTIKELEDDFFGGVPFDRDRRAVQPTATGAAFLQGAPRPLEQARENAKAIAASLRTNLRIVLSDAAVAHNSPRFWPIVINKEPEIEKRLSEVPLAEQLRGLRSGGFTAGFAYHAGINNDTVAEQLSQDSLVIAAPTRHELLVRNLMMLPVRLEGSEHLMDAAGRLCAPKEDLLRQGREAYEAEILSLIGQLNHGVGDPFCEEALIAIFPLLKCVPARLSTMMG
ncbi:LysR family transcriptional regulator [Pseudomonas fluorescens]|uniref:LysR family transcriptional regulator n=1 Tax=Pseudomonas fluorescens TaxID=294 RepID=UPI0003683288|nr:LysR family transcriptional regulator [Pseudomonas fluorescens]OPA90846.1 hypothetical protein BFW86_09220 [Pseudomonas fluorescens]